eukprot:scaffold90639_cov66-Phaeocystis_antarctica.AAC.12
MKTGSPQSAEYTVSFLPRGRDRGGTDALTRRLTLRPEVDVWLDHAPINLSRGRRHDLREDLCAAAGSGIARTTSMLLTFTRSHSHGWSL